MLDNPRPFELGDFGEALANPQLEVRLRRYDRWIRIAGGAALFFLTAGAAVGWWGLYQFCRTSAELNGLGGFLAGTTGALWSAAGLFLIFAAFVGQLRQAANQEEEIRLNRVELRQTQRELRGQKEQLLQQNQTFRKQRFENTFFQLLSLHHQIVNNIDRVETAFSLRELVSATAPRQPAEEFRGRDVFVRIYRDLGESYEAFVRTHGPVDTDTVLSEVYERLYSYNQSDLGHYFRNLYTLVKFVHASDIDDRRQYTNIVRAQLSSHELLLLFYNGLSRYGREKFKPLIEEYALLKNMPEGMLLDEAHSDAYVRTAYGEAVPSAAT